MTRAYPYRSATTKTLLRKRSSTFDLRQNIKTKTSSSSQLESSQSQQETTLVFKLAASSPPPSVSCLNSLFSDLSVKRTTSKRLWGNITARSQRCAHLASLVEQPTSCSSTTITSKCPSRSSSSRRWKRTNRRIGQTSIEMQPSSTSTSATSISISSSTIRSRSNDTAEDSSSQCLSSSSSPSTSPSTSVHSKCTSLCTFPMKKVLIDASSSSASTSSPSWGYFVEAEEEQVSACA